MAEMTADQHRQFRAALVEAVEGFGLNPIGEAQFEQLVSHYRMLCEWNRRVNLTRIVEPKEAAEFHYAESLFGGRFIGDARTVLDAGSGAGFPAIPLAIIRPDLEVTALEAKQKKSLFLHEAKDALDIPNFKVARARLEGFDLTAYDLLTSRAIDRAEEVLPQAFERLRAGQRFMLFSAPDLIAKLKQRFAKRMIVKSHAVPRSHARFVTIFKCE